MELLLLDVTHEARNSNAKLDVGVLVSELVSLVMFLEKLGLRNVVEEVREFKFEIRL